jgi:hypothetical protein
LESGGMGEGMMRAFVNELEEVISDEYTRVQKISQLPNTCNPAYR